MKKRIFLALTLGLVVFGAVFAFAASLGGVTTADLGADDQTVASCDGNGVGVNWSTGAASPVYTTDTVAGYKVNDVVVTGIDASCATGELKVTLTGASNAALGSVTAGGAIGATGTETVNFLSQKIPAESVTGVHVMINGGNAPTTPAP